MPAMAGEMPTRGIDIDPDSYSRHERDELRRNLQITLEQAEKRRSILNDEVMAADATIAACRQGIATMDELTPKAENAVIPR